MNCSQHCLHVFSSSTGFSLKGRSWKIICKCLPFNCLYRSTSKVEVNQNVCFCLLLLWTSVIKSCVVFPSQTIVDLIQVAFNETHWESHSIYMIYKYFFSNYSQYHVYSLKYISSPNFYVFFSHVCLFKIIPAPRYVQINYFPAGLSKCVQLFLTIDVKIFTFVCILYA